jgi:acyl-coenzyme A thioesterase PaaI-like protein
MSNSSQATRGKRYSEGDSMLTHTRDELQALFLAITGRAAEDSGILSIEQYSEDVIVARARFDDSHLRPAGVIAGPNLFIVVDSMGYLVTMSRAPKGSNGFTSAISLQILRPLDAGEPRCHTSSSGVRY